MRSSKLGSKVAERLSKSVDRPSGSAKTRSPATSGAAAGAAGAAPTKQAAAKEDSVRGPAPETVAQQQQSQSAAAAQSSVPAQPSAPEPPSRFERQYSTASYKTVSTLQQLELELTAMIKASEDHAAILNNPPPEGLDPGMRNQLAQLHGDSNKLLATRIDAILTSELNSGKDEARAKRKQLSLKTTKLIEDVEALVKKFDKLKSAGVSAAQS